LNNRGNLHADNKAHPFSLSLLFEYLKLTLNWQIYQVLCTMSGRATSSQKQLEEYKVIFAAKQALLGAWGRNKRQEKQAD
jgi:hypothetical protein